MSEKIVHSLESTNSQKREHPEKKNIEKGKQGA